MTAADVLAALRRHYGCATPHTGIGPGEWAFLEEVPDRPAEPRSRIDALAVRCWRGGKAGHERHAIEVKVTRSDLRAELAKPEKREPWVAVTHRFYLATPAGLADGTELPDDVGLLEVTGQGVRVTRRAPRTDAEPWPEPFAVVLARRASASDVELRCLRADELRAARVERALAAVSDDVDALVRLRDENRQLAAHLAASERREHRAKQDLAAERRLHAGLRREQHPCAVCALPVAYQRGGWVHLAEPRKHASVRYLDPSGEPRFCYSPVPLLPGDAS